jgi:hypothetical protein
MLGEKKVELSGRGWDLNLCEAALAEPQSRGLNPRDNCKELMEFIEQQRLLQDAEVDCVAEDGWLAILMRDVSKVLVDLGMPPISGIPWDPRPAADISGIPWDPHPAADILSESSKLGFGGRRSRIRSRVRNRVKSDSLVGLTLRFLWIRENSNPVRVRVQVSSRAGLIQSVMSADTLGNIHMFLMTEGINQETV